LQGSKNNLNQDWVWNHAKYGRFDWAHFDFGTFLSVSNKFGIWKLKFYLKFGIWVLEFH